MVFEKSEGSKPSHFSGGLLSSLLTKNHSKCLKTAILPLKPTKVDFFLKKLQYFRH